MNDMGNGPRESGPVVGYAAVAVVLAILLMM
jgi:hypothetical protein